MQSLDYNTNQQKALELTKYTLFLAMTLIFWFSPYTHNFCVWLDRNAFTILNSSLLYSNAWRVLWGYLNHPNESWLNIFVMIGINILGIYSLPQARRPQAFAMITFFWIFFQIILLFTNIVFLKLLGIQRASPSLEITPFVVLSEVLNISGIKVSSNCCFPSGHALVLIFWAKFTMIYSKRWVHFITLATAIILTLPRLFSGAHWLSDIIFTICYALLWFKIAELFLEKITKSWPVLKLENKKI